MKAKALLITTLIVLNSCSVFNRQSKTVTEKIDTIVVIHRDTTYYKSDSLNTIYDTIKINGKNSTVFVYRDSITHVLLHEKNDTIKIYIPRTVTKTEYVKENNSHPFSRFVKYFFACTVVALMFWVLLFKNRRD
jgi:hypothetical protein